MDTKILNSIIENKQLFVPLIFTEKQLNVIIKYKDNSKLSSAEKKALYTSITKKMKALELIKFEKENEYYINGISDIMPKRLNEAKEIINNYSKKYEKVIVSGSFLFSENYNDIDIFILRKKGYKEEHRDKHHLIYLTEKRLQKQVIQSATMISISNFLISNKRIINRPTLSEVMSTYHEAVIEKMNKEKKPEMLRSMLFDYYLFCKKIFLNGKEMGILSKEVTLHDLDSYVKELCKALFSEQYLYVQIHEYIATLKDTIKTEKPNEHLIRFVDTYEELIYGKRRSKAEAY